MITYLCRFCKFEGLKYYFDKFNALVSRLNIFYIITVCLNRLKF